MSFLFFQMKIKEGMNMKPIVKVHVQKLWTGLISGIFYLFFLNDRFEDSTAS